jgi:hypothetical protein
MKYASFSVVGGAVVYAESSDINANSTFYPSGNIWSLDGPNLGFLCSICAVIVNPTNMHVVFDKRPLDGSIINVALSSPSPNVVWGTAILQPNGGFAIQIG